MCLAHGPEILLQIKLAVHLSEELDGQWQANMHGRHQIDVVGKTCWALSPAPVGGQCPRKADTSIYRHKKLKTWAEWQAKGK